MFVMLLSGAYPYRILPVRLEYQIGPEVARYGGAKVKHSLNCLFDKMEAPLVGVVY